MRGRARPRFAVPWVMRPRVGGGSRAIRSRLGGPDRGGLGSGARRAAGFGSRRAIALLVVLVLLLGGTATEGMAAEVVVARDATVPAGSVIADDLYVVAGGLRVLGNLGGDLTASAGTVNVVGAVAGGVTVSAARVEIRGRIGRSVRAGGGIVAVYGRVDGDVVIAGGILRLVEGASIGGDVVVLGGSLTVVAGASVGGDVRGTAAAVTIEGRVRGGVRVATRRLAVAPGATVGGALRYRGDAAPEVAVDATVVGPTERLPPPDRPRWLRWLLWDGAAVPRLLLLLGVALAAVLLAPGAVVGAAEQVRRAPMRAGLVGIGAAVVGPLVVVLLAITVVGLPLAVVGAALSLGALYASQAVVGLAIGRVLFRLRGADRQRARAAAALTLGVVLVAGLRAVPIPFVGLAVASAVAVVGLGGVVLLGIERWSGRGHAGASRSATAV